MLGTDKVGDAAEGESERADRLGEKKEVNLDEVLEKEDDRPWGAADEVDLPEVERD